MESKVIVAISATALRENTTPTTVHVFAETGSAGFQFSSVFAILPAA